MTSGQIARIVARALPGHALRTFEPLTGGLINAIYRIQVDGMAGVNRKMMWEALDIILKLWTDPDPFVFKGDYWTVARPEPMLGGLMQSHIRPFQTPHPPIGIAALSPQSDTLRICGQRGYMPLSLNLGDDYVRDHWPMVEKGAAEAGRVAQRSDWRVVRDVFVADTDEEAFRWAAATHRAHRSRRGRRNPWASRAGGRRGPCA